jgi:drug/metabolite transporter (DMT)-like permease
MLETTPTSPRRLIDGVASGLGAAAIWGGMYVVSRVVLDVVPPVTLVLVRLVLGTVTLAVVARAVGVAMPSRRDLPALATLGLVGMCISLIAQFAGTHLAGAANGSLITSATPAFMLVFAWPILGTRPSLRQVVSLVLATGGVLVVTFGDVDQVATEGGTPVIGNLLLLVAAVTWALYSVLGGRASARHGSLVTTAFATGTGAIFCIPLAVWELGSTPIGGAGQGTLLGIAYLGVVSTAGAFYLWNRSIDRLGAAVPGLLFFAQPVVGGLLGATLLGEHLGSAFFAGGVLVAVAVILGLREP